MGVTVRFGEGSVTDIDDNQEGVANNSGDIDEAREGASINTTVPNLHENDPGACRDLRGSGKANLLECLSRLGEQSNLVVLATCASGEVVKAICLRLTRDRLQMQVRPFLKILS